MVQTGSTWRQEQLAQRIDSARAAHPARCGHCGGELLVGRADDVAEWSVLCDAQPVTALGEAMAKLAGIDTYRVRRTLTGELRIDAVRNVFDIRINAADTPGVEVLSSHQCNAVELQRCVTQFQQPETTETTEPPF